MKTQNIGDRIKQSMEEKSLGPAELARLSKLPPSLLYTYLNNTSKPGTDALYKLSRILDKTIDWLVTGEEIPKKAEVITDPDLAFAIQILTDLYQHEGPDMRGWAKITFQNTFNEYIAKKNKDSSSIIA